MGPGVNDTLHGLQGWGKGERYQMHGIVGQRTLGGICWLYSRVGPHTIDFRFRFSAESPAALSVSAECVTSLSVSFGFGREVKFPL